MPIIQRRFHMQLLTVLTCVGVFVVMLLAAGPSHARSSGKLRTQAINMVVIHSTGGPTCDLATGKPVWISGGTLDANMRSIHAHPTLGIHYMIDRDGALRASVPESQVAHHVFRFSGRSIAIELVNDGDGIDPFPAAQLDALVTLLRDIRQRHSIAEDGIVRHSDLDGARMPCDRSRRRKVDPGDAFPFDQVRERAFVARPAAKADSRKAVPANQ
jgi:N-acetylmuramoyl-L-alanine amidase